MKNNFSIKNSAYGGTFKSIPETIWENEMENNSSEEENKNVESTENKLRSQSYEKE